MFSCIDSFIGSGYGKFTTGGFSWMFWGLLILKFAIIAGIIFFGIKLIKKYVTDKQSAIERLNNKYINAEITEEEYIRMKNTIQNKE